MSTKVAAEISRFLASPAVSLVVMRMSRNGGIVGGGEARHENPHALSIYFDDAEAMCHTVAKSEESGDIAAKQGFAVESIVLVVCEILAGGVAGAGGTALVVTRVAPSFVAHL